MFIVNAETNYSETIITFEDFNKALDKFIEVQNEPDLTSAHLVDTMADEVLATWEGWTDDTGYHVSKWYATCMFI